MVRTSESHPGETENPHPARAIGRSLKVAPRATGGTAYASAEHLASLGTYLDRLTALTRDTGWHCPSMIVSFGDNEAEVIVVGVRWVTDAYFAEIR